ncbi:MAG: class I SAM-dependent methyltransferase [Bacillota bacterium]|nr:class I SAM-dependent methyltransferase [Bacillota bacterium]
MRRKRPNVAGGLSDYAMDRRIGIRTTGVRDWEEPQPDYNRFESTPYRALADLFAAYRLPRGARLVDYGCGLGRVLFYCHHRFQVPGRGIELNPDSYADALRNLESYGQRKQQLIHEIEFEQEYAELRRVQPDETVFYFFNPFSSRVFRQVLDQIVLSLRDVSRPAEIILYYPLESYRFVMRMEPLFELVQTVELPWGFERYDRFEIWRHDPETGQMPESTVRS